MSSWKLLAGDEPGPVVVHRESGASPLFLTCDHAGRRLPRRLGDLGLSAAEFDRHIAWDIGALGTSRRLSDLLDATLVEQVYSRLVVDCNRPSHGPGFIAATSEDTAIPGNVDLDQDEVAAREREIHRPYHARIAGLLDARTAAGRPTVLIAMHSFTPVYRGVARPWQLGLLYNRDPRLARVLFDLLRGSGLTVGDNEPYAISDESDYGIPVHGERRGLAHVEIEIRQDLIANEAGQEEWARRLAGLFTQAVARLPADSFRSG